MPTPVSSSLPRDLQNGLVIRRAAPSDIPALIDFQSRVHSDAGWDQPDPAIATLVQDLLQGEVPHPSVTPESFTIVESVRTGQIASAMEMVSQTWNYGGIPFGVGRLELIGTHPEYRNRGLARTQIEEQHRWSQAQGHLVQTIVGIPYFYRQFGYEMALPMGGGRAGFLPNLPPLTDDRPEPYRVRPAQEKDLPFIASLYNRSAVRQPVWCLRGMAEWRYELKGRRKSNANRRELYVITANDNDADAHPTGYLVRTPDLMDNQFRVVGYELAPGHTWYEVTPSVLRWMWSAGEAQAAEEGTEMASFGLHLGQEHPAYEMVESRLPARYEPYAYYLRIANLPGFLNHVAQVLNERLAASSMAGYSGEIKISFYKSGLTLSFLRGKLTARPYIPSPKTMTVAGFPGLTFLQLVFGYHSLEEILFAFPDAHVNTDEARALLRALFPRRASNIWSLD